MLGTLCRSKPRIIVHGTYSDAIAKRRATGHSGIRQRPKIILLRLSLKYGPERTTKYFIMVVDAIRKIQHYFTDHERTQCGYGGNSYSLLSNKIWKR